MNNTIIPYGKQNITKEDIEVVIAALQSDYLTQGPRIKKFEDFVSEMDRADEIEAEVTAKGTPDVKSEEETEEEAEEVQGVDEFS